MRFWLRLFAVILVACGVGVPTVPSDGGLSDDASDAAVNTDVDVDDADADAAMDVNAPDLGIADSGACQCAPAVPTGWQLVTYDDKARNNCPPGYNGTKTDTIEVSAPPSTCTCTCANGFQTTPKCGGASTFQMKWGDNNQCGYGGNNNVVIDTVCTNTYVQYLGGASYWDWITVTGQASLTGGVCKAPVKLAAISQPVESQGRACVESGALGKCQNGQICAPLQPMGESLCIMKAMDAACPAGYPKRHEAGSGVNDTRKCGPDACNTCTSIDGSCADPLVTLYYGNDCVGGTENCIKNHPANSNCLYDSCGGSLHYQSMIYTSQNVGSMCKFAGQFFETGSLGVTDAVTICCR